MNNEVQKQVFSYKADIVEPRRPQSTQEVSSVLKEMDKKYNAVFCTWVRNETNLAAIVSHFVRVANEQPLEQIIHAMQWIIVGWKLRSIIYLVMNVTAKWESPHEIGLLVKHLGNNWKPKFMAELIVYVVDRWPVSCESADETAIMTAESKCRLTFLSTVVRGWSFSQISRIFNLTEGKISWHIKAQIFKWFQNNSIAGLYGISSDLEKAMNRYTSTSRLSDALDIAISPTISPREIRSRPVQKCRQFQETVYQYPHSIFQSTLNK